MGGKYDNNDNNDNNNDASRATESQRRKHHHHHFNYRGAFSVYNYHSASVYNDSGASVWFSHHGEDDDNDDDDDDDDGKAGRWRRLFPPPRHDGVLRSLSRPRERCQMAPCEQ